jgi:hypothetical protein
VLDREIACLENRIVEAEQQRDTSINLPDSDFILEQIRQLPSALGGDERKAATLLGEIFDQVRVYRMSAPGVRPVYHELRFRLKAWRITNAALDGKLPQSVVACMRDEVDGEVAESPEFCLTVGRKPAEDDKMPMRDDELIHRI